MMFRILMQAAPSVVVWFILARPCQAHFLWLASTGDAKECRAVAFFGENAWDRNYHLPDSLRELKLNHRTEKTDTALATSFVEDDSLVGLRSVDSIRGKGVLETSCQYGVYGGGLLIYYSKHYLSTSPDEWPQITRSKQRLDLVPRIGAHNNQIELQVFWDGLPARKTVVSFVSPDSPATEQTTDDQGKVRFSDLPVGLLGFVANVNEKDLKGTIDNETYVGVSHYATLTLHHRGSGRPQVRGRRPATNGSAAHPASDATGKPAKPPTEVAIAQRQLPVPVASFGATVSDGWLYVYGGHIGEAHAHSRENLNSQFLRMSLEGTAACDQLPCDTPLQGLALVAHGGVIYRIGGMSARNAAGDPPNLHSSTDFARYDPETRLWTRLSPLPAGRSSHDAVVLGDRIYVVGGWNLTGAGDGEWHTDSLVIDLSASDLAWKPLPTQPFQSRALAAATWDGKLVAIGGMTAEHEITRAVWIYDPSSSTWMASEPLPGEGMNGFGVSAWNLNGELLVSGSNGKVYRLHSSTRWEEVATLAQPRFFHRLLPGPNGTLLAVGGASNRGHLNDIEVAFAGQ
jgi:hypothetical protein